MRRKRYSRAVAQASKPFRVHTQPIVQVNTCPFCLDQNGRMAVCVCYLCALAVLNCVLPTDYSSVKKSMYL